MKKYLRTVFLISLCLSLSRLFSQQNVDTAMDNKEVLAILNSYTAALKEHDIAKAIGYCSNTKDFLVCVDGKAFNYEEFTSSLRTSFSQIKEMRVSSDTVYVRNIGPDAALITGVFHEGVTDMNNRQFEFDITISAIFLKRNGQWKITYVTQANRFVSN
jgi:hypothetical protein